MTPDEVITKLVKYLDGVDYGQIVYLLAEGGENLTTDDSDLFVLDEKAILLYKNMKPVNMHSQEYVVVNALPFAYGKVVNDMNYLNMNLHVLNMKSGVANTAKLQEMFTAIQQYIPFEHDTEESSALDIDGVKYTIYSVSQPMADTDGTSYVNVKIKVKFSNN